MTLIYISIVRVVTRKWHARARYEESRGEPFFSSSSLTRAFACRSKWRLCQSITFLTACLHEGGGPQVGKVTRLGWVKTITSFTCNLTTPPSRGALSQDYWMVARHVNRKNAGKPRVLVINVLLRSRAALAAAFSSVAFYCYLNNDAKPLPK